MTNAVNAIILAAGKGTRMKSSTIKVLHDISGKSILSHVIDTIKALSIRAIYLVVGYQEDKIKARLNDESLTFVTQKEQLGTGHAVKEVLPFIDPTNPLTFVLAGDTPLIKASTIEGMLAVHEEKKAAATLLTAQMPEPKGYGRIIRSESDAVLAIVEEKDCTDTQRNIREINSGVYIFDTTLLLKHIDDLNSANKQNEFYLTDLVKIFNEEGHLVAAVSVTDPDELLGVNTRQDLAKAYATMNAAVLEKHMNNGVTILDPSSTFIDASVVIGEDSIIQPFSVIRGNSQIGKACRVSAFSNVQNLQLADGDTV